MHEWTIHWLEAAGTLQRWKSRTAAEIEATQRIVSTLVAPPRLDILVERGAGAVIAEIGMVGQSYRATLFSLTVDPDNPNFASSLADGTLRRQVAHEVHHCLRYAGPGYGASLGQALVSEGLAGHFVRRLFQTPPEPWERAVEAKVAWGFLPDAETLASFSYNHRSWFFGAGGHYPRWLGYTLGYMIVGRWLDTMPEVDGPTLVGVSAAKVLAAARRDGPGG